MSNINTKFKAGDQVFTKVGSGKVLSAKAAQLSTGKIIVTYSVKLENQRQPLDFLESEIWRGFA